MPLNIFCAEFFLLAIFNYKDNKKRIALLQSVSETLSPLPKKALNGLKVFNKVGKNGRKWFDVGFFIYFYFFK